jgi:hypothetical protein
LILSVVVVAWCTITLTGLGAAVWVALLGDLGCEAGDSNYGDLEWSAVPPSPRCVWTEEQNGFSAKEDPSLGWSLWLLVVVASSGLVWWQIKATMAEARRLEAG